MSFSPRQWDARAAAKNRREAEKFPLLAHGGLVRQWTGEELAERAVQHRAALDASWAVFRAQQGFRSAMLRAFLSAVLPAAEMAALEAHRWRCLPPSGEYTADFWWGQLQQRGLLEGITHNELPRAAMVEG